MFIREQCGMYGNEFHSAWHAQVRGVPYNPALWDILLWGC
jgi:hypothetical protein